MPIVVYRHRTGAAIRVTFAQAENGIVQRAIEIERSRAEGGTHRPQHDPMWLIAGDYESPP